MNGTIAERLAGCRKAHIDTMTVIYFIEEHPKYRLVVRPVFELLDSQKIAGLSSYLTLLEVLVQPIRQGRPDLARQYRDTLLRASGFTLFPVDQDIAEQGAENSCPVWVSDTRCHPIGYRCPTRRGSVYHQ